MSIEEAIALLCSVLASVVGNWTTRWIADARKSKARIMITTTGASAVVIILAHWHLGRAGEDRAWTTTASSVSLARYCDYVRQYPMGKHKQEALQPVREHIGRIVDAHRAQSSGSLPLATVDVLTTVSNLCAPIVLVYSGEQDLPDNPRPHYVVDRHTQEVVRSNWDHRDKEQEQALSSDLQAAFLHAFGEAILQPRVAEATTGESSAIRLGVRYLEEGAVLENREADVNLLLSLVQPARLGRPRSLSEILAGSRSEPPSLGRRLEPASILKQRSYCYMHYRWHFSVRFPMETQDRYSMDFEWSKGLQERPSSDELDGARRESFTAFGSWLTRELGLFALAGRGDAGAPVAVRAHPVDVGARNPARIVADSGLEPFEPSDRQSALFQFKQYALEAKPEATRDHVEELSALLRSVRARAVRPPEPMR